MSPIVVIKGKGEGGGVHSDNGMTESMLPKSCSSLLVWMRPIVFDVHSFFFFFFNKFTLLGRKINS